MTSTIVNKEVKRIHNIHVLTKPALNGVIGHENVDTDIPKRFDKVRVYNLVKAIGKIKSLPLENSTNTKLLNGSKFAQKAGKRENRKSERV